MGMTFLDDDTDDWLPTQPAPHTDDGLNEARGVVNSLLIGLVLWALLLGSIGAAMFIVREAASVPLVGAK